MNAKSACRTRQREALQIRRVTPCVLQKHDGEREPVRDKSRCAHPTQDAAPPHLNEEIAAQDDVDECGRHHPPSDAERDGGGKPSAEHERQSRTDSAASPPGPPFRIAAPPFADEERRAWGAPAPASRDQQAICDSNERLGGSAQCREERCLEHVLSRADPERVGGSSQTSDFATETPAILRNPGVHPRPDQAATREVERQAGGAT